MNEAFVAFWSTLILICRTSRITLCGDLERKYVVFATPASQKRRRQPIFFILDSLSAQMNVPNTKFSRKTMKHLNHNASTLRKLYSNLGVVLSTKDPRQGHAKNMGSKIPGSKISLSLLLYQ